MPGREARIFDDVRTEVTEKLTPDERVPMNRYFDGSPIYPGHFAQDFNRSYVLEPSGTPVGDSKLRRASVFVAPLKTILKPTWPLSPKAE
jgi:hypothetical protein